MRQKAMKALYLKAGSHHGTAGSSAVNSTAEFRFNGSGPVLPDKPTPQLVHDLRVHQIELELQGEELKRACLELEISRDRHRDLYDYSPVGYFTFSRQGRIMEVNLTGATLLGVTRNKLIQRGLADFIAPEDLDRWERYLVSMFQSPPLLSFLRGARERVAI